MHEPLEINVEKHHENNQIWQLELCMCKNENQKSIPVPAQNLLQIFMHVHIIHGQQSQQNMNVINHIRLTHPHSISKREVLKRVYIVSSSLQLPVAND